MKKLFAIFLLLFVPSLVMAADAAGNPKAVFETTAGNFTCTLFKDKAPVTVENFIALAEGTKDWTNPISHAKKHNTPLYDGTIFHRVIPGFMIQGGDPAGNGTGDPGYRFKDEFDPSLRFDRGGRLAMANSGPNTNGSQFFITEVPTSHLNGRHTIFGQCEPLSLVTKITKMPRDPNDKPFQAVRITHVKIIPAGQAAAAEGKSATPKK
jgi:peptidyl-prolyl cis-trans isomerase A (cyclophilin A)